MADKADPKHSDSAPVEGALQDPTPTAQTGAKDEPGQDDPRLLAALKQLEKAQREIDGYKLAETKRQEAEMSELEREKARAAKLEADLAKERNDSAIEKKRNAFLLAASQAGCEYPDQAFKLADLSGLELSADGSVNGVPDTIKSLKKNSPFLFGTKAASTGGNPTSGPPGTSELTPEKIMAESPEDYHKRIAAFRAEHY